MLGIASEQSSCRDLYILSLPWLQYMRATSPANVMAICDTASDAVVSATPASVFSSTIPPLLYDTDRMMWSG